jgi:hypothetical protein
MIALPVVVRVLHMGLTRQCNLSLQEGKVTKKTQYQVEGLMAVRKAGFESQGLVAVKPELDLVEEDDQIEHEVCCAPAV